ncbi:MAG: DoxX family protein [Burkholderiaceae bacterium]
MAQAGSVSVDLARLLLRVVLGVLILMHGIAKLMSGIGPIIGMVEAAGLPSFVAYGVYVGEVVAPILVIVGLFTRPAASIIAFNMAMAFALAHTKQLVSVTSSGGWALELQAMFLAAALAVALLGAGRFSLGGTGGRFN